MSEELYQKAKAVFGSLIDKPQQEQREELERLEKESPQLAQEVRSLLDYHTEQSFVLPSSEPKIRTRSTLSTTYRSSTWDRLRHPILSLLFALPVLLLGLIVAWWIDHHLILGTNGEQKNII